MFPRYKEISFGIQSVVAEFCRKFAEVALTMDLKATKLYGAMQETNRA